MWIATPIDEERFTCVEIDANGNVFQIDLEDRGDTSGTGGLITTTYTFDILDQRLDTTEEISANSQQVAAGTKDVTSSIARVSGEPQNSGALSARVKDAERVDEPLLELCKMVDRIEASPVEPAREDALLVNQS